MEPMDEVGWSSKIGFQWMPPSVDFQTPPEAVGGVVGERIARHAGHAADAAARRRADGAKLESMERGGIGLAVFAARRGDAEQQGKRCQQEKGDALAPVLVHVAPVHECFPKSEGDREG